MSKVRRLPTHFPVGTKYVVEGRLGHIVSRYIAFPDGRRIDLDLNARASQGRRAFSRPAAKCSRSAPVVCLAD